MNIKHVKEPKYKQLKQTDVFLAEAYMMIAGMDFMDPAVMFIANINETSLGFTDEQWDFQLEM